MQIRTCHCGRQIAKSKPGRPAPEPMSNTHTAPRPCKSPVAFATRELITWLGAASPIESDWLGAAAPIEPVWLGMASPIEFAWLEALFPFEAALDPAAENAVAGEAAESSTGSNARQSSMCLRFSSSAVLAPAHHQAPVFRVVPVHQQAVRFRVAPIHGQAVG